MNKDETGRQENGKIQNLISLNVTTLNCIMNNVWWNLFAAIPKVVWCMCDEVLEGWWGLYYLWIHRGYMLLSLTLSLPLPLWFCLLLLSSILRWGTHFVLDYRQEHFTFYIYAFYIPYCLFLSLHFAFYILCSWLSLCILRASAVRRKFCLWLQGGRPWVGD